MISINISALVFLLEAVLAMTSALIVSRPQKNGRSEVFATHPFFLFGILLAGCDFLIFFTELQSPEHGNNALKSIWLLMRVALEVVFSYAMLCKYNWPETWRSPFIVLALAFILSDVCLYAMDLSASQEVALIEFLNWVRLALLASGLVGLAFKLPAWSLGWVGWVLVGISEMVLQVLDTTPEGLLIASILRLAACYVFYKDLSARHPDLFNLHKELWEKHTELETILSNVPAAVIKLTPALRVSYANKRQVERLGLPIESLIGSHISEIGFSKNYEALLEENIHRALCGESIFKEAAFFDSRLGNRYSHLYMVPDRTADGNIKGMLGFTLDVTDHVQRRLELENANQRILELKAALDEHAIVAITDAMGVITEINEKFCQISQYSRGEIIGRTHNFINSGYHKPEFFRDLWATISAGKVWNGDICNRAKDGSIYWVHTTIVPYVNKGGIPYQYISIRADITARKKAEQEAYYIAVHDSLTGIANRKNLIDRLDSRRHKSVDSKQFSGLLLIDLDEFRSVNGTYGHESGDLLLQQVATRLTECSRSCDLVARISGDEFMMSVSELGNDADTALAQAKDICNQIYAILSQPYQLIGTAKYISPSIGATIYQGELVSTQMLLTQAYLALDAAKASGGDQVIFFDNTLKEKSDAETEIKQSLRNAVENSELVTHYQIIVDSQRSVIGVEALLRWKHPVQGWIPPSLFIPIAEKTGLIYDIGRYVLKSACKQLKKWSSDESTASWTIAVNISASQLYDSQFVEEVISILESHQVDPAKLRLELTESMLIHDVENTVQKMRLLQGYGISFSLDDFGTGYSSLEYLHRLPIDVLKIDKSFVHGITNNSNRANIVRAILSLADSLQLKVIAEGVEDQEQFDFLRNNGCTAFQGYLFGKPGPASSVTKSAKPRTPKGTGIGTTII